MGVEVKEVILKSKVHKITEQRKTRIWNENAGFAVMQGTKIKTLDLI